MLFLAAYWSHRLFSHRKIDRSWFCESRMEWSSWFKFSEHLNHLDTVMTHSQCAGFLFPYKKSNWKCIGFTLRFQYLVGTRRMAGGSSPCKQPAANWVLSILGVSLALVLCVHDCHYSFHTCGNFDVLCWSNLIGWRQPSWVYAPRLSKGMIRRIGPGGDFFRGGRRLGGYVLILCWGKFAGRTHKISNQSV